MLKRFLSLTSILLFFVLLSAQNVEFDSLANEYSKTIKVKDLKKHLEVISSDEFEGRETGEVGLQLAAEYIQRSFMEMGIPLPPTERYYQNFPLIKQEVKGVTISIGDKNLVQAEDFMLPNSIIKNQTIEGEYLLIFNEFIGDEISDSLLKIIENKIIITVEPEKELLIKIKDVFTKADCKALIILKKEYSDNIEKYKHLLEKEVLALAKEGVYAEYPIISMRYELLNDLVGQEYKKLVKNNSRNEKHATFQGNKKFAINIDRKSGIMSSQNVLGYIEGTEKKEELVIVTAHYDHLGKKGEEIYNGADDDGSGTVALLEMAEAFSLAKKNGLEFKRSILFMTVSGEEKGLLGSRYYTDNPVFPLENTITNLNIDMIGRHDKDHEDGEKYIYLIGSDRLSTELHEISEGVNKAYNPIELDYKFNNPKDPNRFYYRSDHYNFARHNIPVIFYFSGVHEDYHKPTDTIDKINFETLESRSRLVFLTAWELLNREERPKLN